MDIFLAAPISGFDNTKEYKKFRTIVISLISELRGDFNFNVYSELEKIDAVDKYDSPEQSVMNDFNQIDASDVFILMHPKKMQTSSLIELGYAFARSKKIMIIAEASELPFLALGMSNSSRDIVIVSPNEGLDKILNILLTWGVSFSK